MASAVPATAHGKRMPPLAIRACLRYDVVTRIFRRLQPSNVLEVGCGLGAFGTRIAAMSNYVGVEPDQASCEVARCRIEPLGGRVIHGTHEAVPPREQYDVVCAFEVLEHIEDHVSVLAQWIQRIKPGGHLVMSVPAFHRRFGPMDTFVGHFRRYEPDELERLLVTLGLTNVSITVYGWPLGYALEAVRNRIDKGKLAAAKERGISVADLTAASGRTFQPRRHISGLAIQAATKPFRYLQRARADSGTGLVAVARRPPNSG